MSSFKKLFTLEDIDDITIFDFAYFREDNAYTIKVLQNLGLLQSFMKCSCGAVMKISTRNDTGDGYQFRCTDCQKRCSVRKNSIFELSKLPLWKSFLFMVYVIQNPTATYETLQFYFKIESYATIFEWKSIIYDLMASKLDEESQKIGGIGVVVQIDETAISKRKYNVGRILKNQQYWMIGGIDEDGNCFLKISHLRNQSVLEEIITNNVEDGSTIWTDGWAGYNRLADLGFIHGKVIHKRRFVSNEGVHTNRIEATWGAFKRKYRNATNKSLDSLPGYISDFLFRRKYKNKELSTLCKYIMVIYSI